MSVLSLSCDIYFSKMSSTFIRAQERLAAIQRMLPTKTEQTKGDTSPPPFPYPVPNSTVSFWRTQLHPLDSHRSTPELPTKCEIVIIGSGYTGASLAHHLLEGNEAVGSSIVILEAREACSGATGRNGKWMLMSKSLRECKRRMLA
jgi:hypothetical protein